MCHPWADYLDTHAQALLELDRLEEARPLVNRLADHFESGDTLGCTITVGGTE